MSHLLEKAYDVEKFRYTSHKVIDLIADHLKKCRKAESIPVLKWKRPDQQIDFWKKELKKSTDKKNPIEFYEDVISRSFQMHHINNLGHQTSVPALDAILAGLVSDFLNNAMPIYETGPVSSAMERIIVEKITEAIGYDNHAGGFLTSGGSLGNLTALLAAKNEIISLGIPTEKLAILVSEEAHYSVSRIAKILGLRDSGILKIPTDKQCKIIPTEIPLVYRNALKNGLHVFAVIGCAGTTSTVSYDDLEAIASFCSLNKIWFHVDAAHGGAVIFSEQYYHLVKGIHLADSVIIDFHKMLMTPTLATAVVFKENRKSYQAFNQQAPYLWKSDEKEEWYNYAKRTFECTKNMMALKIFTLINSYGLELFNDNVNRLYGLGREFAELVQKHPGFELFNFPEANVVCFRYLKETIKTEDLSRLNQAIRNEILVNGEFYIVQTRIKGVLYLRVSFMNPFTDTNQFQSILQLIIKSVFNL